MCKTTSSNSNNSTENQPQDHKLTLGETAQEFGTAMGRKAVEAKDTVVTTLTGIKEGGIEAKNDVKDYSADKSQQARDFAIEKENQAADKATSARDFTVDKMNDARSFTADKIGDMKDSIKPAEPEPKSLGAKIGDQLNTVRAVVVEKADVLASNIQPHPDEKSKMQSMTLDDMKKDDGKKEDSSIDKPVGQRINDSTHAAADQLNQLGNNARDYTAEKTKEPRSWTADKLGNLQSTIEPPKPEPEEKTIGDRLQNVGSAVSETATDVTSRIQSKFDEIRAGDDPHEDPKYRGDKNKPL